MKQVHSESNQWLKDCAWVLAFMLAAFAYAADQPAAADTEKADLDKLVGQPADIAPSAYQYRADRPAEENPPETEFLFSALRHKKAGTLCGLLWEEPRPVRQVVLEWPAAAKSLAKPDEIVLRWFPEGGSASWWCRAGEGTKLREADKPSVSADGRVFTYTLDAMSNDAALDNLIVAVKDGVNPPEHLDIPTVQVVAPETWKCLTVVIGWAFQEGTETLEFDGRVEAYNGIVGKVAPLTDDKGTRMTGVSGWESRPVGTSRRGVTAQLLYVGYEDTPIWPGQAKIEDVNRTIVTVCTMSGSFSFMPSDLEMGPILAPEHGFFVATASDAITAAAFRQELKTKGLKTLRQQIRARQDQSWEGAMRAVHAEVQGDFPPYPQPKVPAPMEVDVPEPHLAAAWKIGATDMLRGATKDPRGKWRFRDPPYEALAHETHLFMRVLDLMGLHQEARDGYEMWLERVETAVPTPDGLWVGGPGTFFSGIEWDNAHGGGISLIHIGMLEHYGLTRDREWLAKNAAKLNANADWMIQQRKNFWEDIPGRGKLWANGLLPPHNIWDSRVWRSWYETNASFCHAITRHAVVIAEVDPEAGRRFAEQAQEFRKDLLAAVDKSLTLSPVIRVRDGTYRSFLPPAPYMRGPASRFMPANFGAQVFGMSMHTPGLYPDAIRGGQHVAEFGLLPASDPRMQGYLDVLEDRLLSENFKIGVRFKDYDPQKEWFSLSGWYYQCGLERTANIHLRWDEPVCFLRTWLNQYAVLINPGLWTFREHTAEHSCMDKPFEEAAFLQRFRMMLVMEEGDSLWLARATPRPWLEQGKKVSVKNAPTHFGSVAYEIVSDVDNGKIAATVEMPSHNPPKAVLLRFRHPRAVPIQNVTVNGKPWSQFSKEKEIVQLEGLTGTVSVGVNYQMKSLTGESSQ
jgi:hypothetical protein